MLVADGYSVLEAADGAEALEVWQARRDSIGLVMSDVHMPSMTGLELYERLRQLDPATPVILATSDPEAVSTLRTSSDPRLRLLAKPYNRDELIGLAADLMTGGRFSRANRERLETPALGENPTTTPT